MRRLTVRSLVVPGALLAVVALLGGISLAQAAPSPQPVQFTLTLEGQEGSGQHATPAAAPARLEITEFPVPRGSRPHDVAPAVDGGVWYTA